MTSADFRAWRAAMGFSQAQAAAALGVNLYTVKNYDAGATRARDADGERIAIEIPRTIALACAALAAGLKPIGG